MNALVDSLIAFNQAGFAHGDAHAHNFLKTPHGTCVIDLQRVTPIKKRSRHLKDITKVLRVIGLACGRPAVEQALRRYQAECKLPYPAFWIRYEVERRIKKTGKRWAKRIVDEYGHMPAASDAIAYQFAS